MNDDDEGNDSNEVAIINISGEVMRFELEGTKFKMKPRDIRYVNKAYATAQRMREGRDPVPSTVEMLTNKKVLPCTHKDARMYIPSELRAELLGEAPVSVDAAE